MGGYKLDLQPTSHTLFFTVTETQCGLRANKKSNGAGYSRCVRACLGEGSMSCALVILAKNHWYLWQDKLAQPCGYSLSFQVLIQCLVALSEEG